MLIKPMQLASCSMTLGHTQTSRVLQIDQDPDLIKGALSCTNLYVFVHTAGRTFCTRGPLWCLLKASNAGLVLSGFAITPVCSEVSFTDVTCPLSDAAGC